MWIGREGAVKQCMSTPDGAHMLMFKNTHCDKDIEYITISCRPFYLPREFNKMVLIIFYLPLDSDEDVAVEKKKCFK